MIDVFENKFMKYLSNVDEINVPFTQKNGITYSYNKILKRYNYYVFYVNDLPEGENIVWKN